MLVRLSGDAADETELTMIFKDSYIDADGQYQLLTDSIFEGMIDVINCYSGLETLGENLVNSNAWNDGLYIEAFRFNKDDPYYDIFMSSDVQFVLPDDQSRLMEENYDARQCGDDFKEYEELEWKELN